MSIITIEGAVRYRITLDPGVWIFDRRKIDLTKEQAREINEGDDDERSIARQWDRETRVDAINPPLERHNVSYQKQELLQGTYGIKLGPFLKNAEPQLSATHVVIEDKTGNKLELAIADAYETILQFSSEGKPLKEDGPVYVLTSNQPFKNVSRFIVK